jgi:hypothetical protein
MMLKEWVVDCHPSTRTRSGSGWSAISLLAKPISQIDFVFC